MARIAIDLDETLVFHTESGLTLPLKGAREALEMLRRRGHYIIVHTCRVGIARSLGKEEEEVRGIEVLLKMHAIPYDEIFLGQKLIADLYVDDRAVAFNGDWTETSHLILERASSKVS